MNHPLPDASADTSRPAAPGVHQLTLGFSTGDAISNDVLGLQRIFHSWGCRSDIFADPVFTSPIMRGAARDYREFEADDDPSAVLLFHFSIGTKLTEWFAARRAHKIMKYHNITPARFFTATNPQTAYALEAGRRELRAFASVPELALGDSAFNERDLVEAGYRRTGVLPVVIDFDALDAPPDAATAAEYAGNAANVLFVGRVSPNKKFEDVIKVFFYFQKTARLRSRLILVGSIDPADRYANYLRGLVRELDVRDVVFARRLPQPALNACYRAASAFVCMSEHEGFCVPLVEAMHFGVPIVAYAQEAVAETLGGAGVLVREKRFDEIAELVSLVISDGAFRDRIVAGQRQRLRAFQGPAVEQRLRELLAEWL
jgi:glycosyltransferase involved in cell wall biosynthesis